MPAQHVPYVWQFPPRHGGVDNAYSAWSNAQRRCTEALRAWQAAAADDRAAAYMLYVAMLNVEEGAAAELARVHGLCMAA